MTKILHFVCLLIMSSCVSAQLSPQTENKLNYTPPITWSPKNYVCQRSMDEITIDGLDLEESWKNLAWSDDFVDIEGDLKPNPYLKTNMKMLWDDQYFYFFAKMEEPHIWGKLTQRDAVIYQDDDFEIFIDPDGDAHNYYEFEINALNTIWDLFMMWPYRQGVNPNYLFNWNVDAVRHAVHIEGTVNDSTDQDQYWTVEIAIPWSALKEMAPQASAPKPDDQWRINFSRVDWTVKPSGADTYDKVLQENGKPLPEDNWVWSAQSAIAMHMPEWWGYVQFADSPAGSTAPAFRKKPDEQIKWALWQLYFQQVAYHTDHGSYLDTLDGFTIPSIEGCAFTPELFAGKHGFQFSSPSCNGKRDWVINEMGKIVSKSRKAKF